jgi:hypothetical protein
MVQTGFAAVGVILAWSVVVGVSLGWINSMRNAATQSKGTLAITTQLGYIVSDSINSVGLTTNSDFWIDFFRIAGMGLIAAASLYLLWRATTVGVLRATGLCMLAMVVFGPVVWPWYFAPAIAMLAVTDLKRWRGSLMVLTAAFACEVFPSTPGGTVPDHNHLASMLVILAIGAIALLLPLVQGWWESAKQRSANPVALAD